MNIIRAAFLLAFIGQSVNADNEIEVYSLSTDNPKPLEGKGFELPNNIAERLGFKYISNLTRDYPVYGNPENTVGMSSELRGTYYEVDVLATIKKIIWDDAFLNFKKAHLAFNMNELTAMVNDVNREIKNNIIAGPVKAIRAINNFSQVVEGSVLLGFKMPNVLVLMDKDKEGVTHFLLIKLSPQAISEIADKAREAGKR